ncbi:MAG TPA: S8 family serine peptidase, partial [Phycisphaerae bacterium]|nr:S8 family serine peptidase [Phycisphaerae bacterium]
VAALTSTGARAGFSNWGSGLDFSAPGQTIVTTDRTGSAGYAAGDTTTIDGTSFSSPYSAAVAALLIAYRPTLTSAEVEAAMQAACRDLGTAGYDTDFGWGFVNAHDGLLALPDCNANGVDDVCELDCGLPGCNVPGCGAGEDCNANGRLDDCDIALSLETDCDSNGRPDSCELAGGTAQDCNVNGMPDVCELAGNDCNVNGVPDDCDTAALAASLSGPQSVTACTGTPVSFTVSAPGATAYQWYRVGFGPLADGGAISGAQTATLQYSAVIAALDNSAFYCVVDFGCLSVTSPAAVLSVPADELTLEVAPTEFAGCSAGSVVVMQVTASDTRTATYQWSKDGVDLVDDGRVTGVQTRTLQIGPASGADTGTYTCSVGNACIAPGAEATISANVGFVDPYIVAAPRSVCAAVGTNAVFQVEADGIVPFVYQWYEGTTLITDGAKFAGTSSAVLTVKNVVLGDDGRQFRVRAVVPSPFCSTYSSPATLVARPVGQCPVCAHVPGDMDGDGDFDLRDMQQFAQCFGADPVAEPACGCANVDAGDTVIDLADWAALEAQIDGPG